MSSFGQSVWLAVVGAFRTAAQEHDEALGKGIVACSLCTVSYLYRR